MTAGDGAASTRTWPYPRVVAIVSMCLVMLVTMVESTGMFLALGKMVDRPTTRQRLVRGLRSDGLGAVLGGVFNAFPYTSFSQNIGLVTMTGVKSRYVVATGGVILVVLGLLPVMGRVIAAVPTPVLGGAGIVLFGTVAASGIRTLSKVSYKNNVNLIIVAASLGFGMIPIAAPTFYHHFPNWFETIFHSGISSAAIMAILLNLIFNHFTTGNSENQSVFAAAYERTIQYSDISALRDGDYFKDGKLFDAEGNEVPMLELDEHGNETVRRSSVAEH